MEEKTIIIRSSGIWDTRSPLIHLIKSNHYINQIYYSSILSITKVESEFSDQKNTSLASEVYSHKKKHSLAKRVWPAFKRSFPSSFDGTRLPPNVGDLKNINKASIRALTEYSLIKYGALFESYAQCWALNYLLARLESEEILTRKERELSKKFAPLNKKHHVPGWPAICKNLPIIKEILVKAPHMKTNPKNGIIIEEPVTPNLNAFNVINFWRDWRNSLVHKSGMVSGRFLNRNKIIMQELQELFPTNAELRAGYPLPIDHYTFRAVTAVHMQAAKAMRDTLVNISNERRGHVNAPKKAWNYDKGPMPPELLPDSPPPLLMEGDHRDSYLWATDASFRKTKRTK